jgi:hypothetical protein
MTEDIYRHKNGLKHINISSSEGFSALFVVNTPVFDNSGVAHGVEHLVFRASNAFPHPETLFQLTSLTDAKINASTFAEATYFHCQSQCFETFSLAVKYLLNGLFDPVFTTADLLCEIHDGDNKGVIYHELLGTEEAVQKANKKSTRKSILKKTNKTKTDEINYGGVSSSIGQLSLNDLTSFHQRFYQAENITLITANADIEQIATLISLLPKQPVLSDQLKAVIEAQDKKTKQYLLNKAQQSSQEPKSEKIKDDEYHQKKYSQAIKKLITLYHLWLKNPRYKEISDYKEIENTNKPLETDQLNKVLNDSIKNTEPANTNHSSVNFDNKLIAPLVNLSSKLLANISITQTDNKNCVKPSHRTSDTKNKSIGRQTDTLVNKPVLPNLFSELYLQAKSKLALNEVTPHKKQAYACDQRNALWLSPIRKNEELIAIITSYIINAYPLFLAPRCQGLCYATQALVIEDSTYLAIFNAFDVSPSSRLKEVLPCLLRLSQNQTFICNSLALAKNKYCTTYQVSPNQVIHLTSCAISTYLQELANSSHPKG